MYEGGYTSAINSESSRASQEAQRRALLQQIMQTAQLFEQQQAQARRQQQAKAQLGNLLPELAQLGRPPGGGPQPPPPGTPSVPMTPPGAAPPAAGPALASQGSMGLLPPPPGPGSATPPPAGAPPGAPPMAKAAGPGVPMPAGAPPGAAGPMPGPPGWKSLPRPPEALPVGPGTIAPPPEDAVMPKQLISVGDLSKLLSSKGIKGEEAMDMLEQWKPYMDSQNKAELDGMRVQAQASNAALNAYAHVIQAHAAERRATTGEGRLAQNQPLVNAKVDKLKGVPGKGTGAVGANLSSDAIEAAAREYNLTRKLPGLYRDQVSRSAILNKAAELAISEGGGVASVPGKVAEFKANADALKAISKDLAAIAPYNDMLEQNGKIAIDLAKKAIATDSRLVNKQINWLRQNATDNPDVAEFLAQTRIVTTEAARVLNNPRLVGQLTDSARHEMETIISGDMPLQSFTRVMERLLADGRNRVSAMERQNASLIEKLSGGKAPDTSSPSAVREFKSEAEAKAAKLDPGTRVKINGISGTWQP